MTNVLITHRTADFDRLDVLCMKYYGHLDGTVEAVLKANSHITATTVFDSGVMIDFPVVEVAEKRVSGAKLWK